MLKNKSVYNKLFYKNVLLTNARFIRLVLWLCISTFYIANGQISILRYAPGTYRSDNNHRVEIYNAGKQIINLSDYVVVTRDYIVKIPRDIILYPGKSYTLQRRKDKESTAKNILEIESSKSYSIRINKKRAEGNYVVLFDAKMRIIDAFYFSPTPNPPFLPDEGFHTFSNNEFVNFYVPPGGNKVWGYLPLGDDPAIAFLQVNGNWKPGSAITRKNPNPAVHFRQFSIRFKDGIVSLKWVTDYEDNAQQFWIDRSENQEEFFSIGSIPAKNNSREFQTYSFYDSEIKENKTYYYRIRNADAFGNEINSRTEAIQTIPLKVEFSIEVIPGEGPLNIRFYSAFSERVRMRILNDRMQVVSHLFDSYVYADAQQLVKLNSWLKPGKYWIVAATDTRRFFEPLTIE
jgi:hypothetical protein